MGFIIGFIISPTAGVGMTDSNQCTAMIPLRVCELRLAFVFHGWWHSWSTPWCIGAIPEISGIWRRNTRKEWNTVQLPFDPRVWGAANSISPLNLLHPDFVTKIWSIWASKFRSWISGTAASASPSTDCKVWIARNISFVPDLIVAVTMFGDMQRGYSLETGSVRTVPCAVIATRDKPNNSWWHFPRAQQALAPIPCVLRSFSKNSWNACYREGWFPTKADVISRFLAGIQIGSIMFQPNAL